MSGDVQPRKRKEKRKKKDGERAKAEAEYLARKLSTVGDDSDEGPAPAKASRQPSRSHSPSSLGEGDSVIHVDHEGGVGGHWCAKIIFFALLGILIALIGLIIIEDRGLTDLDTPVSESRFAQVFDGWVDEGPVHDDHHDEHTLELNHPDEHDDEHEEYDDDHGDDEIEDIESENDGEHDDHDDDDEHGASDDEAEDEPEDDEEDPEIDHEVEEDDDDQAAEDDDDENEAEDDDEDASPEMSHENEIDDDEDSQEADDDNEENDDDDDEYLNMPNSNEDEAAESHEDEVDDDVDLPYDEVDSVEEDIVDNAAVEEEHLAAKQAEQQAAEEEKTDSASGNDDTVEVEINRRMTLIPESSKIESISENDEEEVDEEEEEIVEKITPTKTNVIQESKPKKIVQEDSDEDLEPILFQKINALINSDDEPIEDKSEERVFEDEDMEEVVEEPAEEIADIIIITAQEQQINDPLEQDDMIVEEEEEAEEEEEIEDLGDEELEGAEELEDEEEPEEDISDELDDTELMKKLEEKYGKLPELDDEPEGHSDDNKPIPPVRKKPKPSGGNSIDDEVDDWTDEEREQWNQQLNLAQAEMDEGKLDDAFRHFTALALTNTTCWQAKLGRAKVLDIMAEKKKSNSLLESAINAYREVLTTKISDGKFREVALRLIDRVRFRGKHLEAVPVQKMLIQRFPEEPEYYNQMAISYLMVNKPESARAILKKTLEKWPNDGVALVHYGFILKTIDNNLIEAVSYFQKGINTKEKGTAEGRFLFHLGDALARLNRKDEANEIYKYGASLKVFLSPQQRSLYNVDRLTGRPWWDAEQTPYEKLLSDLEANWKSIALEARQLRKQYTPEKENLKDTGDWSQFELFIRGVEVKNNCHKCPLTCKIVRTEAAAHRCRRGQIKFSAMSPGTHIHAHTGPTNCRLRAHLGLQGTKDTYIRVANETRSWKEGKVFVFDDSFEHEVWHNGTDLRIVLIVDMWHPELTEKERMSLPAI